MALKLTNNATSTLAANINTSQTAIAIQGADAGFFPVLGAGDWCPITVVDGAGNMEIMRCTARSGANLTVVRAQEGTAAKAFDAGARVDVRLTAAAMSYFDFAIASQKAVPVNADKVAIIDSEDGDKPKQTTLTNFKSFLKTYFDALYQATGNYVTTARQIIAGTGLDGGGTLAADRSLSVKYGTTAGTAAQGNDSRIANAVPKARLVAAGNGLEGGGDLSADRALAAKAGTGIAVSADGISVDSTVWRDANPPSSSRITSALGYTPAGLYTGSTVDNTNFPVGSIIAVGVGTNTALRNATPTVPIGLGGLGNERFALSGAYAALSGTWRARGVCGTYSSGSSYYQIFQRTA